MKSACDIRKDTYAVMKSFPYGKELALFIDGYFGFKQSYGFTCVKGVEVKEVILYGASGVKGFT